MCFVKTSTPKIPKETIQEDIVKIHEADADITKNSQNNKELSAYKQNIKTSMLGLEDTSVNKKKTLLGE
ncbi:MAG: hypothetical protein IJ003_03625 [Candidatus Gastranaerophilales bacterium]|nr:hypothetical protein [Candidatus Gastranaerophilales bacterium]